MTYTLISMKHGRNKKDILKAYPSLKEVEVDMNIPEGPLAIKVDTMMELHVILKKIKQNAVVCYDENVIHLYDQKLR